MAIPDWFFEEHESRNIWKPPLDQDLVVRELSEFEKGLKEGWRESDVQAFLKRRPHLFDGLYRHGHGTFVFPEVSFGSAYVADWVIGSGHSGGLS